MIQESKEKESKMQKQNKEIKTLTDNYKAEQVKN